MAKCTFVLSWLIETLFCLIGMKGSQYVPLISWYEPRRTTTIGDTIFASIVNIVTHRVAGLVESNSIFLALGGQEIQ